MSLEKKVKSRYYLAIVSFVIISIPPGFFIYLCLSDGGEFSFLSLLILLTIYLICAVPGIYTVVRARKASVALANNNPAKAEKDANQVRRYFIIALIWVVLVFFLGLKTLPSDSNSMKRYQDRAAKDSLKTLAIEQESYYLDYDHIKEPIGKKHNQKIINNQKIMIPNKENRKSMIEYYHHLNTKSRVVSTSFRIIISLVVLLILSQLTLTPYNDNNYDWLNQYIEKQKDPIRAAYNDRNRGHP